MGEGEAPDDARRPLLREDELQGERAIRREAPRVSRRGDDARREEGAARRRPQPGGVRGHPHAHAGLPERGGAPRRPHPGREEHPVGARDQPGRRHVQDGGRAEEELLRGEAALAGGVDNRVLPHRRAQQPHLVRAEVPARLRERPQLRRILDRMGQHGERAH